MMVTAAEVRGPSRVPELVEVRRQLARYWDGLGVGPCEIGRRLSRCHSTVWLYLRSEGWGVNGTRQRSQYGGKP